MGLITPVNFSWVNWDGKSCSWANLGLPSAPNDAPSSYASNAERPSLHSPGHREYGLLGPHRASGRAIREAKIRAKAGDLKLFPNQGRRVLLLYRRRIRGFSGRRRGIIRTVSRRLKFPNPSSPLRIPPQRRAKIYFAFDPSAWRRARLMSRLRSFHFSSLLREVAT